MGAVLGSVAGSVVSSMLNDGDSGSNAQASQAGTAQSWEDIQKANDLNRSNATWSQQQNQAAIDKAYSGSNTNSFGTTSRTQNADGGWDTTSSLNDSDQAIIDAIRGKQSTGVGNLDTSGSFNVDSDYMKAYKAQQEPALTQSRNTENARLAAMGLSSGSGSAWGTAQDALNRSSNDANEKAILNAHDTWTTDQNTLRSNLGTLGSTESTIAGLAPTDINTGSAAQMGQITANAPTNDLSGAMSADSATDQANNNQIASLVGKGTTAALNSDWWNTAGSSSSGNSGSGITGSISTPSYSW